jgi:conjugal transfer pilus assembly protein TraK
MNSLRLEKPALPSFHPPILALPAALPMPPARFAKRHLAGWLLLLLCSASHGLQVIDTRDGMTHEVSISGKEPTRIRIEGAPITDVFGSVASSNCGDAGATPSVSSPGLPPQTSASPSPGSGELVLECDRDKAEIYVRPVDGRLGENRKAIALFVASPHATYTLMLRRADLPADTIVLRDRQVQLDATSRDARPTGKARNTAPIRAMKALLLAMASTSPPSEFRVSEVGRRVAWWNEAELLLLRRFEGRGLFGEQYLLRNTGTQPLVLSEQEFDREQGRVLGVAIEHHQLAPTEATTVYVIRRGNTP